MPLCDYQCKTCGAVESDVLVKATDAPPPQCPECGMDMRRLPPNSNWAFNRRERRWDA